MKIFVTGASGHIGSLVVPELLGAGHSVIGLARSDESAEAIIAMGAEAHRGSLDDVEGLAAVAKSADGVIHLAFRHDLMRTGEMMAAAESDAKAVKVMGEALVGSSKPFVGVSGTLGLGFAKLGRTGTENDASPAGPRTDTENYVIALAGRGVVSSVVRLAPTVHGPKDNPTGFIPTLIRIAREKGFAGYIGDGSNRWPAVHELDAAVLFRLAVEKAPAGMRIHGVGDEGVTFKEIAETIGKHVGVPAQSVSQEDAAAHFGHLAGFVGVDNPTSSEITRSTLDWNPTHPGLIEGMDTGNYFN